MTLYEAIIHCEEMSKNIYSNWKFYIQLAKWLRELQTYKETYK